MAERSNMLLKARSAAEDLDLGIPLLCTVIVVVLVGWCDYETGTVWNGMGYIGVLILLFIWSAVYCMERKLS